MKCGEHKEGIIHLQAMGGKVQKHKEILLFHLPQHYISMLVAMAATIVDTTAVGLEIPHIKHMAVAQHILQRQLGSFPLYHHQRIKY